MIVLCLCGEFGEIATAYILKSIKKCFKRIQKTMNSLIITATGANLCICLFKKKVHLPNYSKYYSIIQEDNLS